MPKAKKLHPVTGKKSHNSKHKHSAYHAQGTVVKPLHILILSSEDSYEVDTVFIHILQLRKLEAQTLSDLLQVTLLVGGRASAQF